MKYASVMIFVIATAVLFIGMKANLADGTGLAGTGTMAMNSYYMLSTTLYAAAIAAQLIWGKPRSA